MDILDIWRGKLSIRRAINFLKHLPGESALAQRGVAGDGRWSNAEHLLAVVCDSLGVMDFHQLKIHTKSKVSAPKHLPRPEFFYDQGDSVDKQEEREKQEQYLDERKRARIEQASQMRGALKVADQEEVVFEGGDE